LSGKKYSSQDWLLLGTVFLAAIVIRLWLITHTEVMARDGVGLVHYARELETEPWREVLRGNAHPPLYPLAILLVSLALRPFWAGGLTGLMQVSAQLASAIGGILLLVPVYALSRRLFNTRIAFWSTLFVACLPAAARVMSDALTESVFLLFVTLTLWLACRALDQRRLLPWLAVGISGGLAYLARPEGALALIAVGLVMTGWQIGRRDQSWIRLGWQTSGLCTGAVLAMAPYMLVIGGVTNKATGIDVLHADLRFNPSPVPGGRCTARPGLELLAAPMAVYWSDIKNSPRLQRICWSVWAVATEIGKATNYSGWLPGFLGLYIFRRKFRDGPDSWLLPILCGLQALLLCRVAYVAGYVADRHVLLFLVCGAPWAVATVFAIGEAVATRLAVVSDRLQFLSEGLRLQNGHGLCGAFLAGLIVFPLPKTLEPLHSNRAGYHAAGQWLAENANAADIIIDPFSWAEYYSGRTLREQVAASSDHRPFQYIVLGCSDNEHVRLPLIPYAEELAAQGETVFQWSPSRHGSKAEAVAIYRVATDAKAAGGRVEGRLTARPTGSKGP
jgi:4-amino-4-deoxy-L-arabinose transferase-like glycosyltransferase